VDAVASAFFTIPVLTDPVLAFRAGGARVFGRFPYTESAFLGGSQSLRTARRQRFAGDASIYGSTELRLPVAEFAFVFPLNVGLLGFGDIGRVYMDGNSPGGWHKGAGAGFWLGLLKPETNVNVLFTNSKERRVVIGLGFDF
jgi:hemolysin activation/secretion protein